MGQFDDVIDPEAGVTLTPDPQLDPFAMPAQATATPIPIHPAMAMPTPPTSPQAPAPPGNLQRIISSALLGLAAGLGPQHGGAGVAAGLAQGAHDNEQARQTKYENDVKLYHEQRLEADRQQALQTAAQHAEEQRQENLRKALFDISTQLKTVKKKDEYDARINGYANIMKMDPNKLRTMVPAFVAPNSKELAQKAAMALINNPIFKEQLKNNPDALSKGTVQVDLNDDGIDEKRSPMEVFQAAGMALLMDDKGMPVGTTSLTDGPIANLALKAKVQQFRVDNRREPTPKEMDALITAARKTPPQDPEMAGLTKELARQRLHDAQNKPKQDLPVPVMRRVDTRTKAFEALPLVKNVQKMSEAVGFAQSLDTNTKNPADDQALIYAFAKAMDPDSVVREGEYATVQKYAQSWAQSFGFNAARVFSNTTFLTPQARQNMKTTIAAKFKAGKQQYDGVRKSYVDQINRMTGSNDGEEYLTDFGSAFPKDAAASAREKLGQRP